MNEFERMQAALGDMAGLGLVVMVVGGFIGLLVLLAAVREYLLTPRVERRFRNLSANQRGRRAMASDTQPSPRSAS